jgi:tetratricopeptide (TPR) repeat protein
LREELDLTLESSLSYELRGVRALEAHDWTTAAEFFRKGLALSRANTPLKRSLTHKLGTALYLGGDRATALTHFENTVRLAPPVETIDESVAKAHYSIALIKSAGGQDREAIDHLAASVKYQPNYPEAHLALGDTLRRSGRPHDALAAYKEVIAINPRAAQARLGYAIALVQLKRYRETRQWLDEAVRRQPDDLVLRHTLARLLAAAPDAGARDGERAMAIVQELFKTDKSTELGATMAMALAELGEYDKAAAIQRGVIDAAARGGLNSTVGTMTANLKLYERRQPCRTPWAADDPIFGAKSAKTEKLRN